MFAWSALTGLPHARSWQRLRTPSQRPLGSRCTKNCPATSMHQTKDTVLSLCMQGSATPRAAEGKRGRRHQWPHHSTNVLHGIRITQGHIEKRTDHRCNLFPQEERRPWCEVTEFATTFTCPKVRPKTSILPGHHPAPARLKPRAKHRIQTWRLILWSVHFTRAGLSQGLGS